MDTGGDDGGAGPEGGPVRQLDPDDGVVQRLLVGAEVG
jgi:hypothetical protein